MHRNTKVATCCYCGTRAALVLDRARHELTCTGCGAPLHDLKMLPLREGNAPPSDRRATAAMQRVPPPKPRKKKTKKRKSRAKKLFEEAFDLLEDIFD